MVSLTLNQGGPRSKRPGPGSLRTPSKVDTVDVCGGVVRTVSGKMCRHRP